MLIERLLEADDLRHLVPRKRVSLPAGLKPADVTMAMAERLLSLPCTLGTHPSSGVSITLHQGRFGPYVSMAAAGEAASGEVAADGSTAAADDATDVVTCSLPKRVSLWEVDAEQAAELLDAKRLRDAKKRLGASSGRSGTTSKSKASKSKASKSKTSKSKASKSKAGASKAEAAAPKVRKAATLKKAAKPRAPSTAASSS